MIEHIDISTNGQALVRAFSTLPDPRVKGRCLHQLIDVIFIAICAIICGAKHWNEMAEFGRQRINWLKQYIDLENGIPSHQTFCRLFGLIPAEDLLACFSLWSTSRTPLKPKDIIAIDGKTLRKSSHQTNTIKGIAFKQWKAALNTDHLEKVINF